MLFYIYMYIDVFNFSQINSFFFQIKKNYKQKQKVETQTTTEKMKRGQKGKETTMGATQESFDRCGFGGPDNRPWNKLKQEKIAQIAS